MCLRRPLAIRSPRFPTSAAGVGLVLAIITGCAGIGPAAARSSGSAVLAAAPNAPEGEAAPPEEVLFAPLPVPAGFDAERARLPLSEIPDDPPAPEAVALEQPAEPNVQVQRRLEAARRLFDEHRYTETITRLDEALRYDPGNHAAHRLRALACLLSGNEAQARLSAERALALKPDDLASHYVMGRFADRAGRADNAIHRYRQALKCTPAEDDGSYMLLARYYLGLLLEGKGYYAAAVDELERFEQGLSAMDDDELMNNPELITIARIHRGSVAMRVARAHGLLGDHGAAADVLERVREQLSNDAELRTEHIRMLGRAGRLDEAAAEAARFVADTRGDRQAVELLLAVHRAAGHPERGVQVIDAIIAEQPDNLELRLMQVDALLAAGRDADAAKALQALIERDDTAVDARWKLVEIQRVRKDWPAWFAALAGQLAAHPNEHVRAEQEIERMPVAAARAAVDRHLAESAPPAAAEPAEPGAAVPQADAVMAAGDYLMGRLCHRLDRLDDARILFERAIERNPAFLPAAAGVAETYIRQCQWQQALEVLETSAASHESARLERLLGQCHDALDNREQAIAHFERAIEIDRNDAQAMLLLGRLHERNNQAVNAQRQYQAAIAADPEIMAAREALIQSLLSMMSPALGEQQEKVVLNRIVAELTEMQRIGPEDHATLRSAALLKFRLGDREWEPYLEALQELAVAEPDDLRTREDLARALFESRQYGEARIQLQKILAHDSCHGVAHELLAASFTRSLELDEAAGQYRRMLDLYPKRESWMAQFAELRLIQQDYDASHELWNALLSLDKREDHQERRFLYHVNLLLTMHEARRYDDGRRLVEEWLEEDNIEERRRYMYRALLLVLDAAADDYARYVERCRAWMQAEPENRELRPLLLKGMFKAGQHAEAVVLAMSWLSEAPDDDQVVDDLIEALSGAGRCDEAVEFLKAHAAAASRLEDRLIRLRVLPSLYRQARRYPEAIAAIREILEEGQKALAPAWVNLLRHQVIRDLAQTRRYEEAVAQINSLLQEAQREESPGQQAELLQLLSYVYQRQGRADLAEQRLREAHELVPSDVGINNDLGYTLADAGKDLGEAKRMVKLAVGEQPRTAAYLDSYGWVLYKLGDLEGARTWLIRSSAVVARSWDNYLLRGVGFPAAGIRPDPTVKGDGQDAVIFDHLGDAHWRLDEKEEAVGAWERALQIHEHQGREGDDGHDKELADRIQAKLTAAAAGDEPEVAPLGPGVEPAE